ncbi:MAG: hypothetical protein HY321_14490 [Armatimonadetes bacterium]|nr:hypothetical protein [Armatimonadota bacterium]
MRVTMAQGSRAFRMSEQPHSQYIEGEDGELWVIQSTRATGGEYEVTARPATRIEQRLYEQEKRGPSGA